MVHDVVEIPEVNVSPSFASSKYAITFSEGKFSLRIGNRIEFLDWNGFGQTQSESMGVCLAFSA